MSQEATEKKSAGRKRTGHVTLLDIARKSGFSVSTVSIVLSEAPLSLNVAATTREHIREIAAQLGYHPDAYARSLRRRSTETVGVLAYDLSDPYCVPILRGIERVVHPREALLDTEDEGFLALVMDAQGERARFDRYLQRVLERRADGLIVIGSWVFEEANLLGDMRKNNVPIVIVGRDLSALGFGSILVDNEAGGAMALRHLHALGHRKIAVIRGPAEMFDSAPRWKGIQRAARELDIALDARMVFELPMAAGPSAGFEGGHAIATKMLAQNQKVTAVLAFDDLTALGVVRALHEAGLRVPEDCSVMGFDDVLPAELATPAITTIRQPLDAMGQEAAELLMERIRLRYARSASTNDEELHLKAPELVVRSSTASIAAKKRTTVKMPQNVDGTGF